MNATYINNLNLNYVNGKLFLEVGDLPIKANIGNQQINEVWDVFNFVVRSLARLQVLPPRQGKGKYKYL